MVEWSREEILKRAEPPPAKLAGVYLLIWNDNIVYVGQSYDMIDRLQTHRDDEDKRFDSVTYIRCDGLQERLELEARLIDKFDPPQNGYDEETAAMLLSQHREAEEMIRETHWGNAMIAMRTGLDRGQVAKIRSGKSYLRVYNDMKSNRTNKGWQ